MSRLTTIALIASLLAPTSAFSEAGGYLAGRQAAQDNRFFDAARYFERSLRQNPGDNLLREAAITARVNLGNIEAANALTNRGEMSAISALTKAVSHVKAGEWAEATQVMQDSPGRQPLLEELVRAWAVAVEGDVDATVLAFDKMAENNSLKAMATHHKAYALALSGQLQAAIEVMDPADGRRANLTPRSALARVQLLAAAGETDRAVAAIEQDFGATPTYPPVVDLLNRINSGLPITFTAIASPEAAVAEGFATIAQALDARRAESDALVYARFAQFLAPDDVLNTLHVAELLDALNRPDLASENFARVPKDDPFWLGAELGRIDALDLAGNRDVALSALTALASERPDDQQVIAALAELLRRDDQLEPARRAYGDALALMADDHPRRWVLLYSRGILSDQLKDWDAAEADFRAALELEPEQPRVLNYLGYSLVERKENLDEALGMIEQAVVAAPDNGAIVDSLGWVFFRLGRYGEAVAQLERAVELEPREPVITDHFGDALWAVGRKYEAEFQWRRALSFAPDDDLRDRVEQKLDRGLDAVLNEEGSLPLHSSR